MSAIIIVFALGFGSQQAAPTTTVPSHGVQAKPREAEALASRPEGDSRVENVVSASPLWTVRGGKPKENLGISSTVVPDQDGDGVEDVILGGVDYLGGVDVEGVITLIGSKNGEKLWSTRACNAGYSLASIGTSGSLGAGLFVAPRPDLRSMFGLDQFSMDKKESSIELRAVATGQLENSWQIEGTGVLGCRAVSIGDLDQDGERDVAFMDRPVRGGFHLQFVICSGRTGKVIDRIGRKEDVYTHRSMVCELPDLDGDKVSDLAVSAPDEGSNSKRMSGAVDLYSGRSLKRIGRLSGTTAFEHFGTYICIVPGKRSSDKCQLAISCRGAGPSGQFLGRVDIFELPSLHILASASGDRIGAEFGACLAHFGVTSRELRPYLAIGAERGASLDRSRPYIKVLDLVTGKLLQGEVPGRTPIRLRAHDSTSHDIMVTCDYQEDGERGVCRAFAIR